MCHNSIITAVVDLKITNFNPLFNFRLLKQGFNYRKGKLGIRSAKSGKPLRCLFVLLIQLRRKSLC